MLLGLAFYLPCDGPSALLHVLVFPHKTCHMQGRATVLTAGTLLSTFDTLQDEAVQKLELLQQRVRLVKQLFRDKSQTEFIIATIPTFLGVNESSRWGYAVLGTLCSHGASAAVDAASPSRPSTRGILCLPPRLLRTVCTGRLFVCISTLTFFASPPLRYHAPYPQAAPGAA